MKTLAGQEERRDRPQQSRTKGEQSVREKRERKQRVREKRERKQRRVEQKIRCTQWEDKMKQRERRWKEK